VSITIAVALTLAVSPPVPTVAVISSIMVIPVNVSAILPNLFSLVANFVAVLARFAPVALANLTLTLVSQSFKVTLVAPEFFTLSMIAWRIVVRV